MSLPCNGFRLNKDHWRIWLGVNDRAEERKFVYEGSNEIVTFTNWLSGQPNDNSNDDCVNMYIFSPSNISSDKTKSYIFPKLHPASLPQLGCSGGVQGV